MSESITSSRAFQNEPASAQANVPGRSKMLPDVPGRSGLTARIENDKSKPTPPILTPRQLAAVRGLVHGASTDAVATNLHTTRQTINRWRRLPAFRAEMQRLHERLCVQSPVTSVRPMNQPRFARRTTDDFKAQIHRFLNE